MYVEKLEQELQEIEEKLRETSNKETRGEITFDEHIKLSGPLFQQRDAIIVEKRKYAGMTDEEIIIAKLNEILEKLG